ncbi:MAG: hypothetical protein ACREJ8_09130 [Candidatus Methylomirabilales bacterium]
MPNEAPARSNQQREARLLSEFLVTFFPNERIINRVRLGTPPMLPGNVKLDQAEKNLLKRFSRWADALVVRKQDLILIEAEILPTPGIISTLELYARLLQSDEDFKDILHLPLRKMLVWAFEDPVLARIAREAGLEVRIFSPPWVAEELRRRNIDRLRMARPTKTPEV